MTRIDLGLAALNLTYVLVGYALLYGLGQARLRVSDLRLVGLAYLRVEQLVPPAPWRRRTTVAD